MITIMNQGMFERSEEIFWKTTLMNNVKFCLIILFYDFLLVHKIQCGLCVRGGNLQLISN